MEDLSDEEYSEVEIDAYAESESASDTPVQRWSLT